MDPERAVRMDGSEETVMLGTKRESKRPHQLSRKMWKTTIHSTDILVSQSNEAVLHRRSGRGSLLPRLGAAGRVLSVRPHSPC